MINFSKIFRGDRVIWMIFMFLCFISLIEVYSASSMLTFRTNFYMPILKHVLFLLVGVGIVIGINSCKPKYFRLIVIGLPIVWIFLIALQFLGTKINDAIRDFYGFQPTELAKLSLIAFVAFILSRQKKLFSEDFSFKMICTVTVITCALIFKDNISTAVILFCVIFIMMFIGQTSFKKLTSLLLVTFMVLALIFSFAWFFPETARKANLNRVVMAINRTKVHKSQKVITKEDFVITDKNYQATQAKIALGKGGLLGTMPGNGQQRDFLPQAYSDFIYAIIIEEMGFVGGLGVLALYVFLFIRAGTIASRCPKLFPKLLVMGCTLMIVLQACISMAVSVGLVPVTGQPLPLISKGGTSILTTCIYFGIILSVSRYENPRGIMQEQIIDKEFEEEKRLASINENLSMQPGF